MNGKHRHVLMLVENQSVPADPRVWREALALSGAGRSVTVICPKAFAAHKSVERRNGIVIRRYPPPTEFPGKASVVYGYAYSVLCQLTLAFMVYLRLPFGIIHAANPPDLLFLVALPFKLFGARFVYDNHDLAPELYCVRYDRGRDLLYHVLRLLEGISCRLADAIVTSNESAGHVLRKRHPRTTAAMFTVRNDPEPDDFLTGTQSTADVPTLLYLGSINRQDGVIQLIRALLLLRERWPLSRFKCVVVGTGDSLSDVRAAVRSSGLESLVGFAGYVSARTAVHEYLRRADICLEPAPANLVNVHSTFIKIMEYMAAGRPIVAFDMPETRYSCGDESALLVNPGDIEGFAAAIHCLLEDSQLRSRLGAAGRARIVGGLNWYCSRVILIGAYDTLYRFIDRSPAFTKREQVPAS